MVMVMELETSNESDSFEFVWPFFQIVHFRPSPQSSRAPILFLQICNHFALVVSSPLSHALGPSTYFSVLLTGPCHIGVLADQPVYPHLNEFMLRSRSVNSMHPNVRV